MDAVEGVIRQTVNLERLGAVRPAAAGSKPKRRYKSGSPSVTTAA
ncbi:hypothetical protein [Klebsiella pneumoniae IS10]|nr:hypothetical protein [Klebsiella pneumoniae IS10]